MFLYREECAIHGARARIGFANAWGYYPRILWQTSLTRYAGSMKNLPVSVLIALAVALGVIALIILIAFFPQTRTVPAGFSTEPSGLESQEGVLRGTDSYNLPGSPYYGNVTPPAQRYQPAPSQPQVPAEPDMVACTMEAMQCPDGSYVGRTGPNCAFAPCPGR